MSVTLGSGITIGSGITVGVNSFTINSSDFATSYGQGPYITTLGTSGYTQTISSDLVNPYYQLTNPTGSIMTTISQAWTNAGFDPGYAYAWHAVFNGSSPVLVRASFNNSVPNFIMIAIDETNTGWQGGNPQAGTSLLGTFNFPVTLTPYVPTTQLYNDNYWC